MKRRKPNQKTLIAGAVVAGFLLASVLGYFVLIAPQRSQAAELDDRIEATEAKIVQYRVANHGRVKPLRFAELFTLSKAMPDTEDMAGVLLELSRVARDTGIAIESVSPSASEAASGYRRVPIEVVFEGNFYDLSDFLYRLRNLVSVHDGTLEANGRLFSIESLQFGEAAKRFPQLQATLTLNAFVFDKQAATAAGAAPLPPASTTPPASSEGTATAVGAS
jgi:Tfp pilus assembly protein PilO